MFAKKSQLTMFIIVGAVLVILVGLLIYSASIKEKAEKKVIISEAIEFPAELKPVGAFVQTCLKQEAEKTINITAMQGGRPLAPRHAYEWEGRTLSHGYYYGLNELPALEEMQNEMAGHLKIHLNDCLNNLQSFKDKGMNLIVGEMSPSFEVGSDAVVVYLDYPITLKKGTGDITTDRFSVAVPSRLGYLHEAAGRIVAEDVKGEASFFFMAEFDMDINIFLTNTSTLVFHFQSKGEKPVFRFVNTYGEEGSGESEEVEVIELDMSWAEGLGEEVEEQ